MYNQICNADSPHILLWTWIQPAQKLMERLLSRDVTVTLRGHSAEPPWTRNICSKTGKIGTLEPVGRKRGGCTCWFVYSLSKIYFRHYAACCSCRCTCWSLTLKRLDRQCLDLFRHKLGFIACLPKHWLVSRGLRPLELGHHLLIPYQGPRLLDNLPGSHLQHSKWSTDSRLPPKLHLYWWDFQEFQEY